MAAHRRPDEEETDVLAYMNFPTAHRAKLHSTNPLERVNDEIERRTEVVGYPPPCRRYPLEQNAAWAVQRGRYMTLETIRRWAMIPPSAFRQSPADRSGPCRRTWRPKLTYTTPRGTIRWTRDPARLNLNEHLQAGSNTSNAG